MRNRKKLLTTVLLAVILVTTTVLATAASADPSQGTAPASATSTQGHPDSWFTGPNGAGQDAAGPNGPKAANFIQKILDKLNITKDYFQELRNSGMSVKDILIAGVIAKAAKAPMADIVAAKQGGKTWRQIAADNKVDLKNLRNQALGWLHSRGKGNKGAGAGKNGHGAHLTPAQRIAAMRKRVDAEKQRLTKLDTQYTDLQQQAAAQTDAQKKQNLDEKAQINRLQKNVVQAQLDRDTYILQLMQEHQNDTTTNTNAGANTNG